MSVELQFPNVRKQYTGVANPLFVSDISNLTENLLIAMANVLGLGPTDFAIISGMEYNSGAGTYAVGIVYMSGVFYYSNAVLTEGKYLQPSLTNALSKTFPDTVARYIYQVNNAVTSNTLVTGGSPVPFTGNMDIYRLNNLATQNLLKGDIQGVLKAFGDNFIISGGAVTVDGSNHPTAIAAGYVFLGDVIYPIATQSISFGSAILYFSIDTNGIVTIASTGTYQFCDATGKITVKYLNQIIQLAPTDLGDPASADFTIGDFTLDAAIHSLSISSKVPATAKWVLLRVMGSCTIMQGQVYFLKYGNTHLYNAGFLTAQESGQYVSGDFWVPVDKNQKISYYGSNFDYLNVTIAGYM